MLEIGQRIKMYRQQLNLTQAQLAKKAGVRNSVISFYELGDRIPSAVVIKNLATALNVSTDQLLGMKTNKTVDVSGLSNEEIAAVITMVETIRNAHRQNANNSPR